MGAFDDGFVQIPVSLEILRGSFRQIHGSTLKPLSVEIQNSAPQPPSLKFHVNGRAENQFLSCALFLSCTTSVPANCYCRVASEL